MDKDEFYEGANNRILAIFPQKRYHHNAYVIGGRKGLLALRAAIDEALRGGGDGSSLSVGMALSHPGDQEVNGTYVILDNDLDDQELDRGEADVNLPYYDPRCHDELSPGAVNLMPNEQHIMAAGVKAHMVNKRFEEGVSMPPLENDPPE